MSSQRSMLLPRSALCLKQIESVFVVVYLGQRQTIQLTHPATTNQSFDLNKLISAQWAKYNLIIHPIILTVIVMGVVPSPMLGRQLPSDNCNGTMFYLGVLNNGLNTGIYIYISYHRAGLSYSVNLVVYVILYCLHYWIDWDWILLAKTKQNMDTWVIKCIVCLSFFYEVFHCSINLSLPSFELLTGRLTCYKIEYPDSLRSVACFNGNQSYVDHWKGDCCQCTQSRQSKAHQR